MYKKLVFLSDTHNKHKKLIVPDGDIIIHTGDATSKGYEKEIQSFFAWYAALPHKHKIFVPGNHELGFQKNEARYKEECKNIGITLLINESTIIDGINIYGSPVQPRFHDWEYNVDRGEAIKKYWDLIPNDTDILLTHGPAKGILDISIYDGFACGCEELLLALHRVKPDIHAFGHIHAHGGSIEHLGKTMCINASVCDEQYNPTNKIVTIDYNKNI